MTKTNVRYQTRLVAARNLQVGTVCYHGGEIVSRVPKNGIGIVVTFRDGSERYFAYSDRVRIYPNL